MEAMNMKSKKKTALVVLAAVVVLLIAAAAFTIPSLFDGSRITLTEAPGLGISAIEGLTAF